MSRINNFFISLLCNKVGEDCFLNKYYESKNKNALGHCKRYVVYKGTIEPSKVPPMWHAWLHYMTNEVPTHIKNFDWQQNYVPNLTGTKFENHKAMQSPNTAYHKWQPLNISK